MATRTPRTPGSLTAPPEGARIERDRRSPADEKPARLASEAQPPENSLEVSARAGQASRPRRVEDVSNEGTGAADPPDTADALPDHISKRYVRSGNDFHFPNRDLAFTDHGSKLSTRVENTEVIGDLIDIAKSRGWTEIKLAGTQHFKQEAWLQANAAGLTVKYYRASELDQELLRRRSGKEREGGAIQDRSADSTQREDTSNHKAHQTPNDRLDTTSDRRTEREPTVGDTFTGRLLKHGPDSDGYALVIRTGEREITLRGDDLRRAVKDSLSQAKVGDAVSVQYWGRENSPVTRPVRSASDALVRVPVNEADVNRWVVEKTEFVRERAQLAEVVRDQSRPEQGTVARYPALYGTYVQLDAARAKASEQFVASREDQDRFVRRTRERLAQDIERSRPMPTTPPSLPRDRARESRELVQERTL